MRGSDTRQARGVAMSLVASALFGVMFYVAGIVDAAPEAVFGWRVVLTLVCYLCCFLVLLRNSSGRRVLAAGWNSVTRRWWSPFAVVLTAALVGFQMWLFAWAPVHGRALDASLGYLLLPIVLVLVGRLVFAEQVSPSQLGAVAIAAVVVGVKVALSGTLSWVTPAVCCGYALYFGLRRLLALEGAAVFGLEVAVLTPVAVVLLTRARGAASFDQQLLVLVVGVAGAAAMSAYLAASRSLPLPVFGLLSYVEPLLLFGVALLLGEELTELDVIVYVMLGVALALVAVDGFRGSLRVAPRVPRERRRTGVEVRLPRMRSMPLPRLESTGRVGDQVFEAIHSAIIDGQLPAGHRLRIRELAEELGTSVMPVREAIKRLEEVGLAEAMPYRGAVVKGFTYKELLDLYSVRRTLEVEATLVGVGQLTDADVDRLEQEYAAMADAVAEQDAVTYLEHDEAFLSVVYGAGGNPVLTDMIRSLWHRCRSYKSVGAKGELEKGDPALLLRFQGELLEAARSGDAALAGEVTRQSLDAAAERIQHALEGSASSV